MERIDTNSSSKNIHVTQPLSKLIPAFTFALSLTISIVISFTFYTENKNQISIYELENLEHKTHDFQLIYQTHIDKVAEDLNFLARTPPIQALINSEIYQVGESSSVWEERLSTIFGAFLTDKHQLMSLSYVIVDDKKPTPFANRSFTLNNHLRSVDLLQVFKKLQSTEHTYFFSQKNDTSNIKTSYWVAKPVLDNKKDNQLRAYIIAELDFEDFFNTIVTANEALKIADQNGNYIRNKYQPHQQTGMFDNHPSLKELSDKKILESPLVNLKDGDELISTAFYSALTSDLYPTAPKFHVLFLTEKNRLKAALNDLRSKSVILGLTLSLIALAFSFLVARRLTQNVEQLIQAIGDYETTNRTDTLPTTAKDEMGLIARSMSHMMETVNKSVKELENQKFALDQHSIVGITDIRGTIIYANDQFCNISGYTRAELLGQNHRIIKSDYHSSDFFREMYLTISQHKVWKGEICNKAKDGRLYWVDTTIVPISDADGKLQSYIGIRTDITAVKEQAAELLKAKELAEAAVDAKSEFLASMSHEIRTPMNGVLGMLGLLLNSNLDSQQEHRTKVAQKSAESLLTLINDILDFSKIEAGKLDLELLHFNPRKMLGDIADSMAHLAQVKDLELIFDLTGITTSKVIGDPSRIRQVITNLLNNAIKFTEEGEIIVRAALSELPGDLIELSVSVKDTGIGIPEAKAETLFELFTQADASTTRQFGGTGLGLSIAKNLCLLMGGDISVESKIDEGSTFHCTMLLKTANEAEIVQPKADISNLEILIVDDNQSNREVLQSQLELWGASIVKASSGDEAIALCGDKFDRDSRCFDIAIIDMQMPVMDGAELASKLSSDKRFKDMKLVVMTSVSFQGEAEKMAEMGFSAYFPKPATTSDLFDTLRVLSNEGENSKANSTLTTATNLSTLSERKETHFEWPKDTRLLLVEDNQINQLVATSTLKNFGLTADIANNGLEAITALINSGGSVPYNLVFMDCQMPEMDGYEASQAIRAGKGGNQYKDIPIIAMTANAMQGDKEKCLASGMTDYLSKPINNEALIQMLMHYLDGKSISKEKTVSTNTSGDGSQSAAQQEDQVIASLNNSENSNSKQANGQEGEAWSKEKLMERLYGNNDLYVTLLETYLAEKGKYVSDFEDALSDSDFPRAKAAAHLVKGVAGQLSAVNLHSVAESLEKACANNDLDTIEDLSPRYRLLIDELEKTFREELESPENNSVQAEETTDSEEIAQLLKQLSDKLANFDYIEPELLQPLKKAYLGNESLNSLCHKLVEAINLFDNEAASATLKDILKQID